MKKKGVIENAKHTFNYSTAITIFIILALTLVVVYSITDNEPRLSTADFFTGLPEGLNPITSHYESFNGGKTVLINSFGKRWVSTDGVDYNNELASPLSTDSQFTNFKATVAYYHPGNGGRTVLKDATGKAYITSTGSSYTKLTQNPTVAGPMNLGYYHGFNHGRIILEDNTNSFIWNYQSQTWNSATIGGGGLPSTPAKLGYYYRFSTIPTTIANNKCNLIGPIGDVTGDGLINSNDLAEYDANKLNTAYTYYGCLDITGEGTVSQNDRLMINDLVNGINPLTKTGATYAGNLNYAGIQRWYPNGDLYEFKGTGNFVKITPTGLPTNQGSTVAPDTGYFDIKLGKVVLWYGNKAYTSTDGKAYTLSYDGSTTPPITCGNNIKESGESCDGTDLSGITCSTFNSNLYDGGTLGCVAAGQPNECTFDATSCTSSGGGGGGGNPDPTLLESYEGLPDNFVPLTGYWHPFPSATSDGRVILLNSDGEAYISSDGNNFNLLTPLPALADFIQTVAFYHSYNSGEVVLKDATGKTFIIKEGGSTSQPAQSHLMSDPKVAGPMNIGYFQSFDDDGIILEDNSKIYSWNFNEATPTWTENQLNVANLPNLPAEVAYYFNLNGKKETQRWYSNGKVFSFIEGNTGFVDITNQINFVSGSKGIPTVAYVDGITGNIVLWLDEDAYKSSDGRNFELFLRQDNPGTGGGNGGGGTPECSATNPCGTGEVCSVTGICVTGCENNDGCSSGQICSTAGACVAECSLDTHCSSGQVCSADGACVAECTTDAQCNDGNPTTVDICKTDNTCDNPIIACTPDGGECPTDYVCNNAECTEASTCVDNDNGFNYGTASTVTTAAGTVLGTDVCEGARIVEWFCDQDGNADKTFPIFCDGGCSQGACLGAKQPENTCIDSDGGRDYQDFGILEILNNDEVIATYEDHCVSAEDDKLKEYYCNDDATDVLDRTVTCDSGFVCDKGECVRDGTSTGTTSGSGTSGGSGSGTGSTSCTSGTGQCDGTDYYVCVAGDYVFKGQTNGKCNYFETTFKQEGDACDFSSECGGSELSCVEGTCQLEKTGAGATIAIIIIVLILLGIIGAVIYVAMKNKKGHHKTDSHSPTLTSSRPPTKPSSGGINFNPANNRTRRV